MKEGTRGKIKITKKYAVPDLMSVFPVDNND